MLKVTADGFAKQGRVITGPVAEGRGALYTKLAAGGHRIILRNFRAGGKPQWPISRGAASEGRPTLVQRGNLFRSITRRGTAQAAIVESSDFRAAIHHFGGVIQPRNAKALTIPIAPEAQGKRASDFPADELWVRKADDGRAYLMWGGKAMFLLLKSVRMPARPFMDISDPADVSELQEIVRDYALNFRLTIR